MPAFQAGKPAPPQRQASGDLLGDLYQQVCERARKGRALVQTPEFVRSFILDRTLTPSIETFGIERTRLIDPACGTGHSLTDAFRRLWKAWRTLGDDEVQACCTVAFAPYDPPPIPFALAQIVLQQVWGVDLDPHCAAIARYRLTQAAWEATGVECVPYRTNVYEGDSLLHHRPRAGDEERFGPWPYDVAAVRQVLAPGQYTAVVANPPYITCKDARLREAYRERYPSCHGQYSMGVPFTELVFGLAVPGGKTSGPPEGGPERREA